MREVLFVRQAGDLAFATSHLAQSSFASRVTAARAGFLLLSQSGERGRGLESESVPISGPLYLNLGRLLRTSRNSLGPLRSRRLRSWRSSSVADGSLIRSSSWAAISDAFAALFGADSLRWVVSSPSSTSRRMASGRAGLSLCLAAQASTLSRSSDERRMVATVSCPVVRRPFFVRAAICFLFFSPLSSTDPAAIFNPREGRRR